MEDRGSIHAYRSRSFGDGDGAATYIRPPDSYDVAAAWVYVAAYDRHSSHQLGDGYAVFEIASYEASHTRHSPSSSSIFSTCGWRPCDPFSACVALDAGLPEVREKGQAFTASEGLSLGQGQATTRSDTVRQLDPHAN